MKFILSLTLFINVFYAQNDYPIVLIHGFFGWGNDEMGNYRYWGGQKDIQKTLEENGFTVFNVSVGPISSNWDRAVEVYYQLKGGQTDYGYKHAKKYGLIQKPSDKKYKGLYPEWDKNHPVHLIGHSMGGQTARMLQYLLETELFENDSSTTNEKSDLLGLSRKDWISSITSLATPHDGSTLADILTKTFPFIQYFIGLAGVVGTDFYDFDLSQWNLNRSSEESWSKYVHKMRNHNAWKTKNISSWDLSLDGARELNNHLQASADVYYFSIVTSTTEKREFGHNHDPVENTPILIKTRSKLLGSRSGYWADGAMTDSLWFENDGVVNTISMYGPSTGINGSDPLVQYEKGDLLIPGQWYWQKISKMDHWSIMGHLGNKSRVKRAEKIIIDHLALLKGLPNN